ncbi:hypothetical protein ACFYUM_36550 [Streptomyces fimicarius]|uniref:hypothetical protein n=1 Tax=Streptomyces griseus TaxID=1911 RepID=UPI00368DFBFD
MTSIASTLSAPRAGLADDMTRDDNRRGFERDETDTFHQLVKQLVDDGDQRAATAGRQALRTVQEMSPGLERQPVLRMVDRPLLFLPTTGGNCYAPAPAPSMHRPPGVTALTDQERKDLSDKVRDANKRSESRPK